MQREAGNWSHGSPLAATQRGSHASDGSQVRAEQGIPELAAMANVLNPETESITLNTKLETPTLEPATELEQPPYESTSNPETAEVVEAPALDADAPTEPVAEAAGGCPARKLQRVPQAALSRRPNAGRSESPAPARAGISQAHSKHGARVHGGLFRRAGSL